MIAERKSLQVVLLGMPRVGKSALLQRLLENRFEERYCPTDRSEWRTWIHSTDESIAHVSIRDSPGSTTFGPVDSGQSAALLIVYDCTNIDSFTYAGELVNRLPSTQRKVLIAAKCDEMYRRVSIAQGQAFARNKGVEFIETSAKSCINIPACFELLLTGRKGDELQNQYSLRDLSLEEVREVLSSSLEAESSNPRSYNNFSPPLVLTPDSADSFLENEPPEELALVEEGGEGHSVLGRVRLDVQTSEMGTQTEEQKTRKRSDRPYQSNKKKEELDKFWLRQFRKYMKHNYADLKGDMTTAEKTYWKRYLSPDMKPDKDRAFKSYNKTYKAHLFQNPTFAQKFRQWFEAEGSRLLRRRFEEESPEFKTYHQHAVATLLEADSRERLPDSFDPDDFILKF